MKKSYNIVVVAYAVCPEIKSSEGIVNANWIAVLEAGEISVQLFSVHTSAKELRNYKNHSLVKNYTEAKSKSFLPKVIFRIKNKLRSNVYGVSYHLDVWRKNQQPLFNAIVEKDNAVIWARLLPLEGLMLPLESSKTFDFPLVINVNDPVVEDGSYPFFSALISKTQCWTFPSFALASLTAAQYQLDITRCFVLPHAMMKQQMLYSKAAKITETLSVLYTGTFYKSAFTEELQRGLKAFCKSKAAASVSFTFILAQYDSQSIQWLEETIPNVKILKNLEREAVLKISSESDLMLVVDAATHTPLLKGKLAEAISLGMPVLGISYKESVMDSLLNAYGCYCAYQDEKGDVLSKLTLAIESLNNPTWQAGFEVSRMEVMDQFSEEEIRSRTKKITEFAAKRYQAQKNNLIVPEASLINTWP